MGGHMELYEAQIPKSRENTETTGSLDPPRPVERYQSTSCGPGATSMPSLRAKMFRMPNQPDLPFCISEEVSFHVERLIMG
mmetsp:Transcript_981/g.1398  ORF Transcript_981/g.1398 Transcript_981/m.1398 type:complete len:81 (+) Transcript_981:249-491(+)